MSRKLRLVPIDATKNIVQIGPTGVATLTVAVVQLAVAVRPGSLDETDITKTMDVEGDCMIRGFELGIRMYLANAANVGDKVVAYLRKNEGGYLPIPTIALSNSLGAQQWKNRVFHIVSMSPDAAGGLPLGLSGIKIPKRFHKMQQGDVWELVIANNSGVSLNICGYCIYKWYR